MSQVQPQRSAFADDPRVPLAAERTLLAWVRTGLAMMGFGFVVARFGLFLRELAAVGHRPAHQPQASLWIGVTLVLMGVGVCLLAVNRHVRFVNGWRRGEVYHPSPWSVGVWVTLLLAVAGVGMAVYMLVSGGNE